MCHPVDIPRAAFPPRQLNILCCSPLPIPKETEAPDRFLPLVLGRDNTSGMSTLHSIVHHSYYHKFLYNRLITSDLLKVPRALQIGFHRKATDRTYHNSADHLSYRACKFTSGLPQMKSKFSTIRKLTLPTLNHRVGYREAASH